MKRQNWIILLLVVLFPGGHAFGYSQLANSGKQGLNIYSIDRILKLDEDEIDLCTATLILSRQWGTQKTLHRYRDKVDDMALEILARLKKQRIPARNYRAIGVINKYLFDELNFRSVETADDPEDLFLHSVIDKKRGYCLSLSVLYLSIGERLGMPLYGVVVPGHFFVRYDDGHNQFNIETTSKGANAPDKHYLEKFKPPASQDGLYMKNLSKAETLGCFFNNLGNSYCEVGDIDSALMELERAVRINPSLAEAHNNLGNIYLHKGRARDAISEYYKALKILDEDAKTHNNLGNAYSQNGQYNEAVKEYMIALDLEPDFIDAYRNLANTYRRQGFFTRALRELKIAAQLKPAEGETYRLMGDIYMEMDNYSAALTSYQKSLKLMPASANIHSNMGYCYLKNSKPHEAITQFRRAIGLEPSNVAAYFGLARTYNRLEQTNNEINIYHQLLSIEPMTISALQNLGNAYMKKEMYEEAIEQYLTAVEIEPENPALHYNLGCLLYTSPSPRDRS